MMLVQNFQSIDEAKRNVKPTDYKFGNDHNIVKAGGFTQGLNK